MAEGCTSCSGMGHGYIDHEAGGWVDGPPCPSCTEGFAERAEKGETFGPKPEPARPEKKNTATSVDDPSRVVDPDEVPTSSVTVQSGYSNPEFTKR